MNKILLRYEGILLFITVTVKFSPCIFNRQPLGSGTSSNQNGVSNNTIYNVCYGSDGFIWLSTDKGISRYDGFRFRDYPLIMSIDSLSTPLHQAVKILREGPDGLYYALLYQGGIACFDKGNEKFLPVRFDKTLKLKDVLDFYWNGGNLYLTTSQGLFESRVVRKTEGENDFVLCILNPEPLVRGKVAHLCSDGKQICISLLIKGK